MSENKKQLSLKESDNKQMFEKESEKDSLRSNEPNKIYYYPSESSENRIDKDKGNKNEEEKGEDIKNGIRLKYKSSTNQFHLQLKSKKTNEFKKIDTITSEISVNKEEEHKTLRQIFDKFFTSRRLDYVQFMTAIASLVSFLFYILCSYITKLFKYMNIMDIFVVLIYLFEYFVNFILAHHRINYVLTLHSLISILTMLPIVFQFWTDDYLDSVIYKFVNMCRVMRFLRVFQVLTFFKGSEDNNVSKQIFSIVSTILNMVFIIAGLMQIVERQEIKKLLNIQTDALVINNYKMREHFHHFLYFTIVSISTVGFGDILPRTIYGKIIFIVLVFLIIIVIPYQLNDLINLMSAQSDYARKSYKATSDIPHIILVGDIALDSLKSFCQEFFHPDHGGTYRHVVILNTVVPTKEMEIFFQSKEVENFIFYLQGDPLNEKDLLRADVNYAKACVIFNNQNSKDPHSGDHESLFLGIFIKKFVFNYNRDQAKNAHSLQEMLSYSNPNFHLCMQLNKPESTSHYFNSLQPMYKKGMRQDQLIVIESLKMNLLSKSCLTPGIMALVTNLVMTAEEITDQDADEWLKEYSEGRGHEIYRIPLQKYYYQFTFIEVVENIYTQGQVIAFALEIEIDGTSIIKLNPTNCTGLTINELIDKAKDLKEGKASSINGNQTLNKNAGLSSVPGLHSESSINHYAKPPAVKTSSDSKVRIFVYLICSDKSEADSVANKEKKESDLEKKRSNSAEEEKQEEQKSKEENNVISNVVGAMPDLLSNMLSGAKNAVNNLSGKNSPRHDEQKNARKSQILSKDLLKDMNNNINLQTTSAIDLDEYSDSENESTNEKMYKFGSLAYEINENDYYIHERPEMMLRNNNEIIQHSIKDRPDIQKHVIICGLHPALIHFILPLRARYLQEDSLKWIVILAPSLPPNLFDALAQFSRIIFIQGSPLLPENLFRANIANADKAVILSSGESKISRSNNNSHSKEKSKPNKNNLYMDEQMLDAETIFIYKALKKCNKNIQIMTELVCSNNIEYLLSTSNLRQLFKEGSMGQYEFTPLYASGEVFTPSIVDSITCQSYFNQHIVTIIEMILGGQKFNNSSKVKKLDEFYGLGDSNLYLVKIPETQINEAFGEFYYFLLRHQSIGIALYRKNQTENFYYVYTNPKKTTLLREHDYVFVLSTNAHVMDVVGERLLINDNDEEEFSLKIDDEEEEQEEEEESNKESNDFNKGVTIETDDINISTGRTNSIRKQTKKMSVHERASNLNDKSNTSDDKKGYWGGSKNSQFDRIQQRLTKIKKNLENIKTTFKEMPQYIDKIIDKEIDNEMKVYLTSN